MSRLIACLTVAAGLLAGCAAMDTTVDVLDAVFGDLDPCPLGYTEHRTYDPETREYDVQCTKEVR